MELLTIPVTWVVALTSLSLIGSAIWGAASTTKDVAWLKDAFQSMQEDIRKIQDDIRGLFLKMDSGTVKEASPLGLTDLGEKIARELNLREWLNVEANQLVDQIEGKAEFEVHDFCVHYVDKMIEESPQWDRKLRAAAYEYGLALPSVSIVLAIELRNELLRLCRQKD